MVFKHCNERISIGKARVCFNGINLIFIQPRFLLNTNSVFCSDFIIINNNCYISKSGENLEYMKNLKRFLEYSGFTYKPYSPALENLYYFRCKDIELVTVHFFYELFL